MLMAETTWEKGMSGEAVARLTPCSGGAPSGPLLSSSGKAAAASEPVRETGGSGSGAPVEDLLERLRLTAVEAQPVLLDDEDDADLVDSDCALVGKVLSPGVLHI